MNQAQNARIGQSTALDTVQTAKDTEASAAALMDANLYIGVPPEIRSLLSAPAASYGAACDIGTLCAAFLVKHMRADPALIGSNRIGAVAKRMSDLGCDGGYSVGFFSALEHLMTVGANHVDMDAVAIQKLGDSLKIKRMRAADEGAFKAKRSAARGRLAKAASTGVAA